MEGSLSISPVDMSALISQWRLRYYIGVKIAAMPTLLCLALLAAASLFAAPAKAGGLQLPPEAKQGLDLLYSGQADQAIQIARQMEKDRPDFPLGYLLEAESRWWQIYCAACEIKWNMIDAWDEPRGLQDDDYLALTDKAIALAEMHIAESDTAEMELYDGMGWMLRTRLTGLRGEHRVTANAGVKTRTHMLRCLQLDPQMSDAYVGLGLYNYYVDAMSGLAKILRFFMGIPGGSKQEGIRQLRIAMEQGTLTSVEARFNLAKDLRTFDLNYTDGLDVVGPLVAVYPRNPYFHLLTGDLQAKLGRRDAATMNFHAAEQLTAPNSPCAAHIHSIVAQAIALITPKT